MVVAFARFISKSKCEEVLRIIKKYLAASLGTSVRSSSIVINSPARGLGRVFDYKVNEDMNGIVTIGKMVTVPFGIGNRKETAFIIGLKEKSEFKRLKAITEVIDVDFVLGEKEFELAIQWLTDSGLVCTAVKISAYLHQPFTAYLRPAVLLPRHPHVKSHSTLYISSDLHDHDVGIS